jgi:hypothetical protein
MGYSAWAKVVIGIQLTKSDFVIRVDRNCTHQIPKYTAAEFCPTCGKQITVDKVKSGFENYKDDIDSVGKKYDLKLHKIKQEGDDRYILGVVVKGTSDSYTPITKIKMPSPDSDREIWNKISEFITKAEILNRGKIMDSFATYLLLVESY